MKFSLGSSPMRPKGQMAHLWAGIFIKNSSGADVLISLLSFW